MQRYAWAVIFFGLAAGCARHPTVAMRLAGPTKVEEAAPREPPKENADGAATIFPPDAGGRLLAERLAPERQERPPTGEDPGPASRYPPPAGLDRVELPLPAGQAEVVRLPPTPRAGPPRLSAPPDEPPLVRSVSEPSLPRRPDLPK